MLSPVKTRIMSSKSKSTSHHPDTNRKRKHPLPFGDEQAQTQNRCQSLAIIDDRANQIIGGFLDKKFRMRIIRSLITNHIGRDLLPIYEKGIIHKVFGRTYFDYRRYKFRHLHNFATPDGWDVKLQCEFPPLMTGRSIHSDSDNNNESKQTVIKNYPNNISYVVDAIDGVLCPKIVFTNPQPIIHIAVRTVLNYEFMKLLREMNTLKRQTESMEGDYFLLMVGRYAPKGNLPLEKIQDIFHHSGIMLCVVEITD